MRGEGYRWYDRQPMRRFMLARLAFGKNWHPERKRLARLRALYWSLLRGYETEICARHGGPVGVVFHVPTRLWLAYSGFPYAPAGVLCIQCFDDLYWEGRRRGLLYWTCSEDEAAMVAGGSLGRAARRRSARASLAALRQSAQRHLWLT